MRSMAGEKFWSSSSSSIDRDESKSRSPSDGDAMQLCASDEHPAGGHAKLSARNSESYMAAVSAKSVSSQLSSPSPRRLPSPLAEEPDGSLNTQSSVSCARSASAPPSRVAYAARTASTAAGRESTATCSRRDCGANGGAASPNGCAADAAVSARCPPTPNVSATRAARERSARRSSPWCLW